MGDVRWTSPTPWAAVLGCDRAAGGLVVRLTVGITQGVPKPLVQQLLAPVVEDESMGLVVVEGTPHALMGDLVTHEVDVILSDGAIPLDPGVRAHTHLLGSCGVSFLAAPALADMLRDGEFPQLLDRAPWLLPTPGVPLRRALDVWMTRNQVRPRVAAEFDDSSLITAFGAVGDGVFAAPTTQHPGILEVERVARELFG